MPKVLSVSGFVGINSRFSSGVEWKKKISFVLSKFKGILEVCTEVLRFAIFNIFV